MRSVNWDKIFIWDTLFNKDFFIVILLIAVVIIWNVVWIIYYLSTKFTTNITVRKTYTRNRYRSDDYFVVDINNIIYKVDNLWFILDFNRADEWANLEEGKTYKINGYGKRIDFMDKYPTIYSIEQMEE